MSDLVAAAFRRSLVKDIRHLLGGRLAVNISLERLSKTSSLPRSEIERHIGSLAEEGRFARRIVRGTCSDCSKKDDVAGRIEALISSGRLANFPRDSEKVELLLCRDCMEETEHSIHISYEVGAPFRWAIDAGEQDGDKLVLHALQFDLDHPSTEDEPTVFLESACGIVPPDGWATNECFFEDVEEECEICRAKIDETWASGASGS